MEVPVLWKLTVVGAKDEERVGVTVLWKLTVVGTKDDVLWSTRCLF